MLKISFSRSVFANIESSLWPLVVSFNLLGMFIHLVLSINKFTSSFMVFFSFMLLLLLMFLWWSDVMKESLLGIHNHKLELSLRIGMLLFILSEVFFFLSFFWAFFDASLAPTIELGMQWPPKGIQVFSVYSVPLLNTIILLSSGLSITWAHHALINNFYKKTILSMLVTVLLGIYFLGMQYVEYKEASFSISDSIYGSTFFMATGFHGFHVMVGATFIFVIMLSIIYGNLYYNHHFSFEAAAWYWHFVDVVWLFLFMTIYWWASVL